nr:aspartate dehydrogenase domain-containing protein [Allopusillimonas ginsengisoli]
MFRGTVRNAACRFPKNANVAATVALAPLGLDQVEVELIADPSVANNIHEIEARGRTGHMALSFESRPATDNRKRSAIPY